jgi:hypothetical protein
LKLLKPFKNATTFLQTQKFPTLSNSKIIEKLTSKYYSDLVGKSKNQLEKDVAQVLVDNLQKYLDQKLPSYQKKDSLVSNKSKDINFNLTKNKFF